MKCTIAEYMQKRCKQGGKPLIIVCALQYKDTVDCQVFTSSDFTRTKHSCEVNF